MKVMLLFPPHWTPAMPHLALPALTAYLRAQGVQVIQRDLNLETFEHALTRDYLAEMLARLCQDQHCAPPQTVERALAEGPELAAGVEQAVRVVRSDSFLEGPAGVDALLAAARSLELASLPFYPAALELSRFAPAQPVDRSASLLRAVRDPRHNMFVPMFRRFVIPDIERERPELVGVSIATMDQMLAGLTLAYLIKEGGLGCHVTVGGAHVTMLRQELGRLPALFDLVDSAVAFEGEVPLLRLTQALAGDGHLTQVPNLIYRRGGHVRANPLGEPVAMAELPPPDFDGLPLERYLAPQLVLPLASSRGCYHGRCAFCNVGYGRGAPYQARPAQQVAQQMRALCQEHRAQHIFFADEVLSPHLLREMSAALERAGSPIHWCGCARLEPALSEELLAGMARGGCRMLLFGLETASPPVMTRMAKGTQREAMGRILEQSAAAGIWNHVFFFFGFPGETLEQAQETVDFVYAHQEAIHSASPGTFLLERDAPVHRRPGEYGIACIREDPERDLAIHFEYEVESGMDEAMAELAVSGLLEVLPEKRYGHLYVNDVYRFLYACRLHEEGRPLPPWLVPEAG